MYRKAHDLALAYAQAKLEARMRDDPFDDPRAPQAVQEMHFIMDEYQSAYEYFAEALGMKE